MEEEALRPDRGRRAAAAAQAARSPAAAQRRGGHWQSQGAPLRQHEDCGLRGAEGQVYLLYRGHDGGERDRLQVPAGRGLERRDNLADGSVQEPAGDPGRQVHPTKAAAARRPDARTEDRPELPERGVTRGEPRRHRRAFSVRQWENRRTVGVGGFILEHLSKNTGMGNCKVQKGYIFKFYI